MKITPMCAKHKCNLAYPTEGIFDEIISGEGPYELKLPGWFECLGLREDIEQAECDGTYDEDFNDTWCTDSWYFEVEGVLRAYRPADITTTIEVT